MEGQMVALALILAIPLIVFPAAFVWFLTVSGVLTVMKEARKRRIAREKAVKAVARAGR